MSPRRSTHLTIEHALLGFLTRGPRHGYDIYQEFSRTDHLWMIWRIKQSRLYALLARLEEHGYLSSSLEPQGGRPPRKLYQLTSSGRRAYEAWLTRPIEHGRQFRLELLTKLFFARRDGQGQLEALIQGQQQVCRGWLEELATAREEAGEEATFQKLVHDYRVGQVRAMIAWLDQCKNELVDYAGT